MNTSVAMQGSLLQRNVHTAPHWITIWNSHEVEGIQISLDRKLEEESIEYTYTAVLPSIHKDSNCVFCKIIKTDGVT